MRHFLFTVPPIAVLAGLGLHGLLARLQARRPMVAAFALTLVVVDLGWNASTLYRLHPDEYLYFNPLVGGLAGASRRYDTDYWVNIMPEAVTDLEHFLDRTERESPRPGRGTAIWSRSAASACRSKRKPTPVCNGRATRAAPSFSSRRRT